MSNGDVLKLITWSRQVPQVPVARHRREERHFVSIKKWRIGAAHHLVVGHAHSLLGRQRRSPVATAPTPPDARVYLTVTGNAPVAAVPAKLIKKRYPFGLMCFKID